MQEPPQGWDLWFKILGVGGIAGIIAWVYRLWRHLIKPLEKEVEQIKQDAKEAKSTARNVDEKRGEQVDSVRSELRKQDSDLRTAQTSLIKDTMQNEAELRRTETKVEKLDDELDKTKDRVSEIDKGLHGTIRDVQNLKDKRRDDMPDGRREH